MFYGPYNLLPGLLLLFFHWIEKWSSRGRAMDSSGPKVMMRGMPAIWKQKQRSLNRFLQHVNVVCVQKVYYLSEGFKACLESFWS